VVADALRRIGGVPEPPVRPTLGSSEPWNYRNRIRLHAVDGRLGFVSADGVNVVPIDTCPIACPASLALMSEIEGELPETMEVDLRVGLGGADLMIVVSGANEALDAIEIESRADVSLVLVRDDGSTEVAAGRPFMLHELCGHRFIVPAQSFFQVNSRMAEELVRIVGSMLPDSIGLLADAHSGVGTFGILHSGRADEVVTIEADPASVGAAIENASGLSNLTLFEAEASEGLAHLDSPPDAVIVDPPRTGLDKATVRLLCEQHIGTICYVSCEPSTLARDVRQLTEAGWELTDVQPLDMFPQTYHIESVSQLRRR
jgi:23S rRNA (uracil1939-C5)-methyltransferase